MQLVRFLWSILKNRKLALKCLLLTGFKSLDVSLATRMQARLLEATIMLARQEPRHQSQLMQFCATVVPIALKVRVSTALKVNTA